ncbi:MAG: phosphoadenylyl-sulfate reductase [Fluviicoccus sp.]|uniref:phosphoadenylyl-sulfate reductase n=1 Tax=Fluviicoccus sp. TaxID=2003552 RepID=UPI002723D2EC|nr:phosphoadenylyl-sulfate reductase [Fluviicoccus sp.]MDO8331797.1 phosphoadenylyl-sulfate reductase [Fluviicoccus sp.]
MTITKETVQQWAADFDAKTPQEILALALDNFGENAAISFSGADDVVLVDMAARLGKPFRVFSLDTGRLHGETYRLLDKVRDKYKVSIEICFPDATLVEEMVNKKGMFSFYTEDHKECCGVRKVAPLRKKLATLDAWITGQRKDQSPGTRVSVPVVQPDAAFSGPGKSLVKFNPLANWTSEQVWDYIRAYEVPYNELHEKGFTSIGCEPCTRPVLPNQHEREGRWWWEEATKKECGLHVVNLK